MPKLRPSQLRFVRESLRKRVETLYLNRQIDRPTRRFWEQQLGWKRIRELSGDLYGPDGEATVPENPSAKLVFLSMREMGKGKFNLLVFKGVDNPARPKRSIRCLVGHRFTEEMKRTFRWNLRELFGLLGIEEDYTDLDAKAENIISSLHDKIRKSDFCLFDNKETTRPSKPNVYIEAGMALALRRPFIFCHFSSKEVWPSDFSNINYISYTSYNKLFDELYTRLPIFLHRHVPRWKRGRN